VSTRGTPPSSTCALHEYVYELRRGEQIVATGLVRLELELVEGDRVALSGQRGIVRTVIPALPGQPQRLVVQLLAHQND
jgi:hypothetical protein